MLKSIQDQYKNAKSFQIKMTIKAFESAQDDMAYFTESVAIHRMNDNYLVQSGTYDILYNDAYYINVNRQFKQLQCKNRDKAQERELQASATPDLDSLFSFFETPVLISTKGDVAHYRVTQKYGDIKYADILINNKEKRISELRYYYDQERYGSDQYATITFETFSIDAKFDNKIFDAGNYVKSGEDGRLIPASSFKGYDVITDN